MIWHTHDMLHAFPHQITYGAREVGKVCLTKSFRTARVLRFSIRSRNFARAANIARTFSETHLLPCLLTSLAPLEQTFPRRRARTRRASTFRRPLCCPLVTSERAPDVNSARAGPIVATVDLERPFSLILVLKADPAALKRWTRAVLS